MAARDARGRRTRAQADRSRTALHDAAGGGGDRPDAGIRALRAGTRLGASYVNFYLANGALILPLLDARTDAACGGNCGAFSRDGASLASRRARFCSAAGICIASRSSSRQA